MLAEYKKISWGSIIAGLVTVIALLTLMSFLGTSMGLAMIDPNSSDSLMNAGMTVILWTVFSFVVSLFIGGYVAGKLAATTGAIHGFLVWATTLVVYMVFTALVAIGAAKVAGSAISATGSAVTNLASGTVSAVGQSVPSAAKAVENIFSGVDVNADFSKVDTKNNIREILRQTGIETLQPEYLQKQLAQSAKDIKAALKSVALEPNDADATLNNLNKTLKDRMDKITANIDKDSVVTAIEKNTDMNRQEAEKLVDNYLETRNNIQATAKARLDDAQKALEKAKDDYRQFVEKAKQQADLMASQIAKLSLWAFIALTIGLVISAIGGCIGARCSSNKVS